jgi:DNA-binding CsgD family transcriptional regulator
MIPRPVRTLTPRERELVAEILKGQSNRAIAACLGTSVQTVRNQLTLLYRKLGVSSRLELAARCRPPDVAGAREV